MRIPWRPYTLNCESITPPLPSIPAHAHQHLTPKRGERKDEPIAQVDMGW